MADGKGISVIIRTSEACNLSCRYCYVKPTTQHQVFPLNLFEQLLKELSELGYRRVVLYWHGGEPLLAGVEYYREAVRIEQQISLQHSLSVANKMQTNGTLLTRDWIEFFKANEFRVGLSLDGDQVVNDRNRVHHGGQSSFDAAMRGLELMKAAGLDTSMLSVLTREHVQRIDEYYTFVKQTGVRTFKVNPCLINKLERPELQVQPTEWGRAMIHLFDLWFHDDKPPFNREFYNIIKSFFVGRSGLCVYNRTCFLDFLSVVPSGDVFPCARLINEDPIFALGNIATGMNRILANYRRLAREYDAIGCSNCKWQSICHGGCTAYAHWGNGTINSRDYLCEGYKILFQHMYDTVQIAISEGRMNKSAITQQHTL